MNQDQLRAKTLALFHALVSKWANELRKDVTSMQDDFVSKLDALQERMSRYEENIDETKILAFANEAAGMAMGGGGGQVDSMKKVREAVASIDRGQSLTEVLTYLLAGLAQFAPRVALFILKGGSCIGWNGRGFDDSPGFSNDQLKRISVPASANTVFKAVIDARSSYLGESTAHRDNVQLLSRIGNVLPSNIFATPLVIRDRIAAVIYADSGDGPERLEGTEAMEVLTFFASKVLDTLSAGRSPGAAAPSPEPAPPPPPEEPESETVMFQPSQLARGSSGVSAAPSPAPSPAPVGGGGPDLDTLDADARQQHEDAIRFARLLVSEIKLYNDAKVKQGRESRDIYVQLRDDIERSRQLYTERVPSAIRDTTNYFNEELVRILADGDAAAMGHPMN